MGITPDDFAWLKSMMKSEIARCERNPNTYMSNLWRRALEIVNQHVDEHAEPVPTEQSWRY